MGDEEKLPLEHGIVSARMCGAMSVDTSFERLYRMYAPVVIGWLAIRVEPHAVDDLLQDVWTVFYGRWRAWQQPAELKPTAGPGAYTSRSKRTILRMKGQCRSA